MSRESVLIHGVTECEAVQFSCERTKIDYKRRKNEEPKAVVFFMVYDFGQ
jgi:hypothetical protein